MGEQKQFISHHCMGYFSSEDSAHLVYYNCFEDRHTGKMFLQEDRRYALVIGFCPFCGKESAAHLAENKVVEDALSH